MSVFISLPLITDYNTGTDESMTLFDVSSVYLIQEVILDRKDRPTGYAIYCRDFGMVYLLKDTWNLYCTSPVQATIDGYQQLNDLISWYIRGSQQWEKLVFDKKEAEAAAKKENEKE